MINIEVCIIIILMNSIKTVETCKINKNCELTKKLPYVRSAPPSQFLNGTHKFSEPVLHGQNDLAHVSEPLSSPSTVGQNEVIWKVVAGRKCT